MKQSKAKQNFFDYPLKVKKDIINSAVKETTRLQKEIMNPTQKKMIDREFILFGMTFWLFGFTMGLLFILPIYLTFK